MKLEIDNLSIKFGGIKALSNVSFQVGLDEFVGLMGPNGAGKTTVINCISGIYKPETGSIKCDGHDLLKLSGDEIVELGIARTFQDLNFFNLVPDLNVMDYLKLGQFINNRNSFLSDGFQLPGSRRHEIEAKKHLRKILEFFREARDQLEPSQEERGYPILYGREGFPDLIDVEQGPIGRLSFAWRRRLDLARALVSKPKLLLLDEPAQGLAPTEIENLGRLLGLIRKEFGTAALIVEHNMAILLSISDRVIVMNYGEKIAEGTPNEVRSNPEVIRAYLGSQGEEKVSEVASKTPLRKAIDRNRQPLLQVKNLDLYYGQAQALFSVSIEVFPEQVTTVLGTNGSGKSTLLRAISGVERPTYGEILVNGEYIPLGWPEAAVEKGIQYVPQGHIVFSELTVRENLRLGAYILEKRSVDISSDYEKVFHFFPQLKELLDAQASSLSGGQQQMLAIAQALMARPKLLLLDEPSLGLSPILVETIFSIIQKISEEEKCSVLLVEQNVGKALEVSDYVYMLSAGVVIGQGSSGQFLSDDKVIKKNLGFY